MNQIWPKPVAQSLPDQVAELIVQRIATGELSAGHRLPSQRRLAQSMGVGLAVVREAVKRLEALSILGATHGSGTVVRPFRWMPLLYDPSLFLLAVKRIGIRDLWETRRLLEGQIARLAAERATAENLKEIRAVLERAIPLPLDYCGEPGAQPGIPYRGCASIAECRPDRPPDAAARCPYRWHRPLLHRRHEPAHMGGA